MENFGQVKPMIVIFDISLFSKQSCTNKKRIIIIPNIKLYFTYTHTHTRSRTRAHTHTRSDTHTYIHTYIHILEVFDPPANITRHIMLRLRCFFFCAWRLYVVLRKVDLELYIPCTICVFGGTPFKCLAWLSSI